MKIIFTYFLNIVLYFTLFLKIVLREQQSNSVKKIIKQFSIFENKKLFLNCQTYSNLYV